MEEKKDNLKFGKQLTLRARAGLSLLAILSIFVSDIESGDLHAHANSLRSNTELNTASSWLQSKSFARMVERHNRYLPALDRWRRLFAVHAAQLAGIVKTFPGSEGLSEDLLRQIIAEPQSMRDSSANAGIFRPWMNYWSGFWSNGAPQFHVWDSTLFVEGRWIQPVSLSETRFVKSCCVEEMLRRRQADIAINVFSREHGITGWVSKSQHGKQELPHIGYLLNDTTLLWICQIKDSANLLARDTRWFVFLETVEASGHPAAYRIFGQLVTLTDKLRPDSRGKARHRGVYYARDRMELNNTVSPRLRYGSPAIVGPG